MSRRIPPRQQRGLSLIELMIALLIGLVLLLGVIQVFSASRTAYSVSQGLARVQENSRFAMDYLTRDIRMAGHMGCTSDQILAQEDTSGTFLTNHTTFGAGAVSALQFNYAIQGYEAQNTSPGGTATLTAVPTVGGGFSPALPTDLSASLNNRVAGSDILVLRYLDASGVPITTTASGSTPVLTVSTAAADWDQLRGGITQPSLFGLTRCDNALVFQASAVTAGSQVTVGATALNAGLAASSFDFRIGAMLYRAESEVYYVGYNATSQRPSLYRLRFSASPGGALTASKEELVEGVESMQLLYGQDAVTGTPNGAVSKLNTADGIQASASDTELAWRRVLAVQIGLVMASPDRASAATADKLVAQGVTFTVPTDGRMRSVYQSTVTLRNRLYGN